MERGICPIVVLCFAVVQMRSFFNIFKALLVNKSSNFTTTLYCDHFGSRDVIGHVTIRFAVSGYLSVAH